MIFKILIIITIGWFCFMTFLSHQTGEQTTEFSKEIVEKIIEYFQLVNYDEIHYTIRKLAHPFVFSIFVLLVLFTLSQRYKDRKIFIFAVIFMVLWTWIDEFTKLLVSGRHFSWQDTLLNLLGVMIGIVTFILFKFLIKK